MPLNLILTSHPNLLSSASTLTLTVILTSLPYQHGDCDRVHAAADEGERARRPPHSSEEAARLPVREVSHVDSGLCIPFYCSLMYCTQYM